MERFSWEIGTRDDWRYRWVEPGRRDNRTKEEWPYSYSDHYLWGERRDGNSAVYSDRLAEWSREDWSRAWAAIPGRTFRDMSPDEATKFLSAYFGRDVTATALAEGCNVSSGYPYWIIWFDDPQIAETPPHRP